MYRKWLVVLIVFCASNVQLRGDEKILGTFERLSKNVEKRDWKSVFAICTDRAKRQVVDEHIDLVSSIDSKQIDEFVDGSTTVELFTRQLSTRPYLVDTDAFKQLKVERLLEDKSNDDVCKMLTKLSSVLGHECTFGSKLDALNGKVNRINRQGGVAVGYVIPRKQLKDTMVGIKSTIPIRVRFIRINGTWKFDGFVEGFEQ